MLVAVCASRPLPTVARGVVALTVLAGVTLPVFWWCAGPLVLALGAFALARNGGLLARPSAHPTARIAGIGAAVMLVILLVMWVAFFISDFLV